MGPLHTQLDVALAALSPRLLPTALAAARLAPILYLAPTFGGRLLPGPVRAAFAVGLGILLAGDAPVPASGAAAALAFAGEALVGLSLGLAASLPFEMARGGGHLVDTVRGAAMVQALVPTLREQASPVGDLLYLGLLALVTSAGGDRLVVGAVARSFQVLPAGAALAPAAAPEVAARLLEATGGLLGCALSLAAPALVAALAVDLLLGVVGRMAPALPLFFLGLPAKALVGLLVVALGAALLFARLETEVGEALGLVDRLAAAFAGGEA